MSAHSEKGFTLIELLVAITVAGVALVVVISAFGVAMKNVGLAEDYTVAGLLMKKMLVEMEAATLQPGEEAGDFGERYPRFKWQKTIASMPGKPCKKAVVKVVFTRDAVERELSQQMIFLEKSSPARSVSTQRH
ncbi:MAG: hypothetical protein C0624_02790 [Desulfuromonas sp.]|nr:MAG: hypothetical protein C0624_02790 [Desulfuromonas sp.]